jgi:hypothetical protein
VRRLRLDDVLRVRFAPGRSVLLFLTDRCPVGCAHCSVDSRPTSPSISDFELFDGLLDAICEDPRLTMVGISGGEPFVERRGLLRATERLVEADKDIVLYTSGVWAAAARIPDWIPTAIARASTLFLSTDAFHAEAVDDRRYVRAARTIADCGVPIVVQVLDLPEMIAEAERLLELAFGKGFRDYADLSLIEPLPYGRGAALFGLPPEVRGGDLPACSLLAAPVVRYDGRVTACCNEQVIMGMGPDRLRRRVATRDELAQVLRQLRRDAVLQVIGRVGAGALTEHPRFADMQDAGYRGICDFCWRAQERSGELDAPTDALLQAMALVRREEVGAGSVHH